MTDERRLIQTMRTLLASFLDGSEDNPNAAGMAMVTAELDKQGYWSRGFGKEGEDAALQITVKLERVSKAKGRGDRNG